MGTHRSHRAVTATLAAPSEAVFLLLDDPVRPAVHMEQRSGMLAGGKMRTEMDEHRGQAVGSVIRMSGRVLGMSLWLEDAVVERAPPHRKTWETLGEPRLLVIGRYSMGFDLARGVHGTRLRADGCVRKMLRAAAQAVNGEVR